jgi:dTMP kinase
MIADLHQSAPPGRGRFITFEGGEGSGKTTQLRRLGATLRARGFGVTETREPGGTPLAEAVREYLLSGRARALGPDGEAVLFAAARAAHLEDAVRPALARGEWVLSDRFLDSTRAYQGAAGANAAFLAALERATVRGTMPDLTLILDLPVAVGIARAAARGRPDRFEADALGEHTRRRERFLAIAAGEPSRCVVVDATGSEEQVATLVLRTLDERLGLPVVRDGG